VLSLAQQSSGSITPLILLVALVAFFWLVVLRPQRNRQRQTQQMQRELAVGAQVMTTAGLFATVVGMDDESVTLEVAPGVYNRYVRAAVAKVIPPPEAATGPSADEGNPPAVSS